MKLAILGFGREGKSVLNFLRKSKTLRGDEIFILDKNPNIKIPKSVHAITGKNCLKHLRGIDVVFRSPGIPYNLPELQRARKTGVLFSSATKLFFGAISHESIVNSHLLVIGITGTKGKGTTATILYNILKNAGEDVFLAGNIGIPALDLIPKIESRVTNRKSVVKSHKSVFVILELSSFQLQDLEVSPSIAVVTDVFPDHQDSHKNLAEYYNAKTRIARYQKKTDSVFFMANNAMSRQIASKSKGRKIAVDEKTFSLFSEKDLKIRGDHNFKNAAMAATVAKNLGVATRVIVESVKKFAGTEHRLEFVRRIGGVEFYNDSASTNPHTTAAAIRAFATSDKRQVNDNPKKRGALTNSLILIAGGQDKNLDYAPLAQALKKSNTKLVVLMGENRSKIARTIKGQTTRTEEQGIKIMFAKNLKDAISKSYEVALSLIASHLSPVVIFSPGATSFDMFRNYAERGKEFKKTIENL